MHFRHLGNMAEATGKQRGRPSKLCSAGKAHGQQHITSMFARQPNPTPPPPLSINISLSIVDSPGAQVGSIKVVATHVPPDHIPMEVDVPSGSGGAASASTFAEDDEEDDDEVRGLTSRILHACIAFLLTVR